MIKLTKTLILPNCQGTIHLRRRQFVGRRAQKLINLANCSAFCSSYICVRFSREKKKSERIERKLKTQNPNPSAFWRSISASLTSKNSSSPIGHLAVIKLLVNQFKMIDDEDNLGHLLKAWALLNEFVKKEPCRTCVQAWRMLMWTTKMLSKKNPYK